MHKYLSFQNTFILYFTLRFHLAEHTYLSIFFLPKRFHFRGRLIVNGQKRTFLKQSTSCMLICYAFLVAQCKLSKTSIKSQRSTRRDLLFPGFRSQKRVSVATRTATLQRQFLFYVLLFSLANTVNSDQLLKYVLSAYA